MLDVLVLIPDHCLSIYIKYVCAVIGIRKCISGLSVEIIFKTADSTAKITFRKRNMGHTSKFRLFKPHRWP